MTDLSGKVDYVTPDGFHTSTAYVHDPLPVSNLENIDGSPATDYPLITCGVNKYSNEPVALQWDESFQRWRQLVLPGKETDCD